MNEEMLILLAVGAFLAYESGLLAILGICPSGTSLNQNMFPSCQPATTTTNVGTTASAAVAAGTAINTSQSVNQNGVQVYPQAGGGSSCSVGGTSYYSSTSVCPPVPVTPGGGGIAPRIPVPARPYPPVRRVVVGHGITSY